VLYFIVLQYIHFTYLFAIYTRHIKEKMPQSGITDHVRGQFKSACLKLQPIKLTVLLNTAWAELSNKDCTISVEHHNTASFWQVAKEAAPSFRAIMPNQHRNMNPWREGGKSGMPKLSKKLHGYFTVVFYVGLVWFILSKDT